MKDITQRHYKMLLTNHERNLSGLDLTVFTHILFCEISPNFNHHKNIIERVSRKMNLEEEEKLINFK